jgi:hypothetical protein
MEIYGAGVAFGGSTVGVFPSPGVLIAEISAAPGFGSGGLTLGVFPSPGVSGSDGGFLPSSVAPCAAFEPK